MSSLSFIPIKDPQNGLSTLREQPVQQQKSIGEEAINALPVQRALSSMYYSSNPSEQSGLSSPIKDPQNGLSVLSEQPVQQQKSVGGEAISALPVQRALSSMYYSSNSSAHSGLSSP